MQVLWDESNSGNDEGQPAPLLRLLPTSVEIYLMSGVHVSDKASLTALFFASTPASISHPSRPIKSDLVASGLHRIPGCSISPSYRTDGSEPGL